MISNSGRSSSLQDRGFIVLLVLVTLAFGWILIPFYGAVFWAAIMAIMFARLNRRLVRAMRQRPTLAALTTVLIILIAVILPTTVIGGMLVQEGANLVARMKSGEFSLSRLFDEVFAVLPGWATNWLQQFGLGDMTGLQERITSGLMEGSQVIATQAVSIGQITFQFLVSLFVMLYLLFFLLRDGDRLARRIKQAIPLHADRKRELFAKFAVVIRATVKGNIVVALVQGALGGLILWFLGIPAAVLWAVVMAFLSLLPAVGAALVWLPIAIYFLVTGSVWQGVLLIAWGVLVIGLVDNFLRPMLVGKDTKMPDYVVLVSTLGGMAIFGINGFVIGPVIAAMFIATWDILSSATPQIESNDGR